MQTFHNSDKINYYYYQFNWNFNFFAFKNLRHVSLSSNIPFPIFPNIHQHALHYYNYEKFTIQLLFSKSNSHKKKRLGHF